MPSSPQPLLTVVTTLCGFWCVWWQEEMERLQQDLSGMQAEKAEAAKRFARMVSQSALLTKQAGVCTSGALTRLVGCAGGGERAAAEEGGGDGEGQGGGGGDQGRRQEG